MKEFGDALADVGYASRKCKVHRVEDDYGKERRSAARELSARAER